MHASYQELNSALKTEMVFDKECSEPKVQTNIHMQQSKNTEASGSLTTLHDYKCLKVKGLS